MMLGELLDRMSAMVPLTGREQVPPGIATRRVSAVDHDSRRIGAGGLFVAVRGQKVHGAAFAAQAVARGALAVIADEASPAGIAAPWLVVPDARLALAAAAAVLHRHPSEALLTIGVTGTNGKTTTTYLLCQMLEAAGLRSGRIGTIGYRIGDLEREASRTTPEASDTQRLLREMVEARCAACVMEVSSHALALGRVAFIRFAGAVFTNLTRDHLDFHAGMEDYFLAKRRLFEMLPEGAPAVLNVDDPYGARLASEFPRAWTYALDRPADVAPTRLSLSLHGLVCDLHTPRGPLHIAAPLLGRPNAYNIAAAAAMALALDVPHEAIVAGCAALGQVPGRLERVSTPDDDISVLVDYAHTDDALKNLLETARPLTEGRLVTVFGCGGDRDRTKRPLMGAVAGRLSDYVVLTSDNPRSEDPSAIIDEIKKGLVPPDRPLVRNGHPVAPVRATPWTAIVERRAAIDHAIAGASAGDLVVIAGKGHEKYQEVAGRVQPFDDVAVARDALTGRRARRKESPR
jgi:UDP-N-acetylmuramoyl-L-alanyl-D-glutamate--2,6-diaminopimelate ligase